MNNGYSLWNINKMATGYKYDKSTYCHILINYFYRYRPEFFIHTEISVTDGADGP